MIDAESPRDILSDDTIVDKLRESGIEIARRTVAKYREAMRIPNSAVTPGARPGDGGAGVAFGHDQHVAVFPLRIFRVVAHFFAVEHSQKIHH